MSYGDILEATLGDLKAKQKDITKLFPEFYSRVEDVRLKGGIRLVDMDENGWTFQVKSVSEKESTWYDVQVLFGGVREVVGHHAMNKNMWTKGKDKVDVRKVAEEVMYNVDIKLKCSCPADLYWGAQYIRSQQPLDANTPPPENRPPVVRNPGQHGAYCKHIQLVINLLPMYGGTFAKWLGDYWMQHIQDIEQKARREGSDLKGRAEEISKEEISPEEQQKVEEQ